MSREINKVSVDDMESSVKKAIVDRVTEETKDIPTTEMLGQALLDERPLPKYNKDAETPAAVYERQDLIEDEVWENIWVSDWSKTGQASTYVNFPSLPLPPFCLDFWYQ